MSEHSKIRERFTETFIQPYSGFVEAHKDWISEQRGEFNEEYYNKMFMWDKISGDAREVTFSDALAILKGKAGEVYFMTEDDKCAVFQVCRLNSKIQFVASSSAMELAECIEDEWFTAYELYEQDMIFPDAILSEDLYVFDKSFSWCIVFTHETDENEAADSRLCLYVSKKLVTE